MPQDVIFGVQSVELFADHIGTSLKLSASLLTHITLDGANLSNPLGFSGHLLRLNLLNVFA